MTKTIESIIKTITTDDLSGTVLQDLLNPKQISQPLFLSLQALAERLEMDAAQGRDCEPGFSEKLDEVHRLMEASTWTLHPDHGCVLKADVEQLDRQVQAETQVETMLDDFLPPWANGKSNSYTALGVQLRTRDGRRIGNAVLIGHEQQHGLPFFSVVTDAGNQVQFTERQLEDMFHPPAYTMDISTYAGVKLHANRTAAHPISGRTADELWLETGRLRSVIADMTASLKLEAKRSAVSSDSWADRCNGRDVDAESQRNLMWSLIDKAGLTGALAAALDERYPVEASA